MSRELDAKVAEARGWTDLISNKDGTVWGLRPGERFHRTLRPCYSTDIAASMDLLEETERNWEILKIYGRYQVAIAQTQGDDKETLPLAVVTTYLKWKA